MRLSTRYKRISSTSSSLHIILIESATIFTPKRALCAQKLESRRYE
ncbi:hypothetical protein [Helicobacter canis]|nr:hypothetical protein [Helicobacter canis]